MLACLHTLQKPLRFHITYTDFQNSGCFLFFALLPLLMLLITRIPYVRSQRTCAQRELDLSHVCGTWNYYTHLFECKQQNQIKALASLPCAAVVFNVIAVCLSTLSVLLHTSLVVSLA